MVNITHMIYVLTLTFLRSKLPPFLGLNKLHPTVPFHYLTLPKPRSVLSPLPTIPTGHIPCNMPAKSTHIPPSTNQLTLY